MQRISLLFFLGLIVLIAAFFRFPYLNYSPPELFGDEIDVGYQAYSLLMTGKDMFSHPLPTYIRSLAEWRAPLLMYASIPSITIFGLSEWGVRVPEAIFGTIAPILLIYLVYQTAKNKTLCLWSGFFLAILPWHIHYSRAAFEVVLMLDLGLLGTIFFLKRKSILSAIFFALTLYTYSTAVVFVPLLVLGLIIFNHRLFNWRFFAVAGLISAPLLINIFLGNASSRFNSISVLNNKDVVDEIFTLRKEAPGLWGKVFYNRPAVILGVVANNYLRAFSTDFLFVRGDPNYRQNLQIIGELLPVTSIFILFGLIWAVVARQWLWLTWLLLSPIPAALTADGANHATRLFWMIPPLVVIMAWGFTWTVSLITPRLRRLGMLAMLTFIAIQLVGVSYYYLNIYRLLSWRWWNVGFKDAMTQVAIEAPRYHQVFINNTYEPSLTRFLFWTKYSPVQFQKEFITDVPTPNIVPGYDGFRFADRYYFGSFNTRPRIMQPNSLYVLSQRDDPDPSVGTELLHTSTNGLFEPIFYLATKHD